MVTRQLQVERRMESLPVKDQRPTFYHFVTQPTVRLCTVRYFECHFNIFKVKMEKVELDGEMCNGYANSICKIEIWQLF